MAEIYGLRSGGGLEIKSGSLVGANNFTGGAAFQFIQSGTSGATVPSNLTSNGFTIMGVLGSTDGNNANTLIVSGAFVGDGRNITNINVENLDAAGSNHQVQFNDDGEFGASANFTFVTASAGTTNSKSLIVGASATHDISASGDILSNARMISVNGIRAGSEATAASQTYIELVGGASPALQPKGVDLTLNDESGNNRMRVGDAGALTVLDSTGSNTMFKVDTSSGPVDSIVLGLQGDEALEAANNLSIKITGSAKIEGDLIPVSDNQSDLGSASKKYAQVHAHSSSLGTATMGNSEVIGTFAVVGNTTIGDAATDTLTITADLASDLIPSADNSFDLGSAAAKYAQVHTFSASLGTAIMGNSEVDGTFRVTGNTTLGNAATDTVTFVADLASDLIPNADNSLDLGSAAFKYAQVHAHSSSLGTAIMGASQVTSTFLVEGASTMANISGSQYQITDAGAANFDGNLTVGGTTQFGGTITPEVDASFSLGSPTKRWANVFTGDLHLRNERGDWTLFEEADHIKVRNNLTGKMFRMALVADE